MDTSIIILRQFLEEIKYNFWFAAESGDLYEEGLGVHVLIDLQVLLYYNDIADRSFINYALLGIYRIDKGEGNAHRQAFF